MKRNRVIGIFLLLCIAAVAVHAEADGDIYDREYLIIDNVISSDMEVVRTASDSELEYISTELFFQPVSDPRLEVIDFLSIPKAEKTDSKLTYRWEGNYTDDANFQLDSTIKTKTVYDLVPNKVPFPIKDLDEKTKEYLKETATVDYSNAKIRDKANELVAGEDDLYVVANKIAIWIQENVEYNLSTVTADAAQSASWVMVNRYGVCDEITNLFLAMTRSVGIPSRFISGLAYTNSPLFENKWGPHGWAEVYFPEYGWIPFDITYNQYGWLDPSHIKLRESVDAKEPSTRFEWRGRNVDLKVHPLDMKAKILDKGPKINYQLEISAEPLKDSVGFDSHNLIKAEIVNYNNYYKTTDISLAPTQGMTILDKDTKTIVLKPYEKEEVFWKVKLDEGLDNDYVYTFPILVYNQRNITSKTEFKAKNGEPVYSAIAIEQLQETMDIPKEKVYTKDLQLSCNPLSETMFPLEKNYLNCTLKNSGNKELEAVNVCYESECQLHNLLIGESKEIVFQVQGVDVGKNEELVSAKLDDLQVTDIVEILVADKPSIVLEDIEYPKTVNYEDDVEIKFTLDKESLVNPIDIRVEVTGDVHEYFTLDELASKQRYVINTKGAYLKPGKNKVTINLLYHDEQYKRYTLSENFTMTTSKPTFGQRIMMYVNRFGLWFDRFMNEHEELLEE